MHVCYSDWNTLSLKCPYLWKFVFLERQPAPTSSELLQDEELKEAVSGEGALLFNYSESSCKSKLILSSTWPRTITNN